jgi:hypothetical protein
LRSGAAGLNSAPYPEKIIAFSPEKLRSFLDE